MSFFQQILSNSGLQLQDDGQPVINVDSIIFIKNLTSNLKNHTRYPTVVNDFFTEFSEFVDDTVKLRKCLMPALSDLEHNTQQDSLIRLLLKIDDIQPKLCQILLEKTVELSADESTTSAEGQLPKLLLYQFKWLDNLMDSTGFCDKLLEIFSVLNIELQKDLIALVPEIIDDKSHYVIAAAWNEKLKENPELTMPLLHSLTSLSVAPEVLEEMQSTALKLIESVEVTDIPSIVKIVLQNLSEPTALDMLQELKTRLNSLFDVETPVNTSSSTRSTEVLVLDAFQSALRFQKSIGDILFKLLDPDKNSDMKEFHPLDFFLLLMLTNTRNWQKKSEQAIVSCIKRGLLTEKILGSAFHNHPQICIEYFKPVQQLGELLTKKSETLLRNFGGLVYQLSFFELNDNAIAHQVIMNLIPHVRSGVTSEIDGALDILLKLTKTNQKILSYGAYLKSLLDYVGTMSLTHVRKIYDVLGHIVLNNFSSSDKSLEDDLYIIVRKQLSNSNPTYRLMGVIGAVNDLRFLVSNKGELSERDFQSACDMVKLIESHVENNFWAKALYYDELSAMLDNNDVIKKFQVWVTEHVATAFQDIFIVDGVEENITKIPAIRGSLQYDLDTDEKEDAEEKIAINLLGISVSPSHKIEIANRYVDSCLAPHFRLLQKCETLINEGLEGIDAVLGCAIHFISENVMDRFQLLSDKEKKFITRCHFTLINFFIELINAFSNVAEDDVRRKVLKRFKKLVEMREKLAGLLPMVPGFVPFVARPDTDESAAVIYSTTAPTTNAKKRTLKGGKNKTSKKTKRNGDNDDDVSNAVTQHDSEELDEEDELTKSDAIKINWSRYQVHFRELDLEVFHLLKCEMIPMKSTLPSSSPKLQLSINELLYLYEDLLGKVKVVTEVNQITSLKRTNFFLKGKVVAPNVLNRSLLSRPMTVIIDSILKLLRFARRHMDSLLNYMGLTSDVSSTAVHVEEAANLCYVILSVIEASLNLASASKQHFSQAIKSLAPHGTDRNSQEDVIAASQTYLLDLIDRSPGLAIAVATLRCLHNCKSVFEEIDLDLLDIAEKILFTDWKNPDRQLVPLKNTDVAHLLRIWLDSSETPLKLIEKYIAEVLIAALDAGGEDNAKFSLISRKTLHIYCEVFYEKTIQTLEKLHNKKNEKRRDDMVENLYKEWKSAISVFHSLISLIKDYDTVQILATSLKHSKRFLSLFSRFGIRVLNDCFRSHKEEILGLFKVFQQCTRVLQNVCSHSKVSKNLNLTNRVPLLKKELERMIFDVKKLLASNKCSNAFWLGNLKNRTLKGEEILSQESTRNNTSEDENEELEAERQLSRSNSESEPGDDNGYQSECY